MQNSGESTDKLQAQVKFLGRRASRNSIEICDKGKCM